MLFPYNRFTIETTLTVDKVIHALSQVVQPSRPFWPNPFSEARRHFVGSITKENFRIVRNIYYLNSFLPEIKGIIETTKGATNIKITMIGNFLILICFVTVFAFFAFFFLVNLPTSPLASLWVVLGSLAAGGLGYLTYTFAFALNVAMDREYLLALFLNQKK